MFFLEIAGPPARAIFEINWTLHCKSPKKRGYAQILRSKMSAHVVCRNLQDLPPEQYFAFQYKRPIKPPKSLGMRAFLGLWPKN